jgi:curli biogenesis system outer membrane secretion channel CsgG
MKTRICLVFLSITAALALTAYVVAAETEQEKSHKNKYQNIEVSSFDVKDGINLPAEYVTDLKNELVSELQNTKKFKQVLRDGESATQPDAPTIRLIGTVTEYKPGSRAKRYFIGFGAGKTKIVAHIKLMDRATGEALFEDDVDGKVIIGLFGGNSKGAANGLAKEVAKVARNQFF